MKLLLMLAYLYKVGSGAIVSLSGALQASLEVLTENSGSSTKCQSQEPWVESVDQSKAVFLSCQTIRTCVLNLCVTAQILGCTNRSFKTKFVVMMVMSATPS